MTSISRSAFRAGRRTRRGSSSSQSPSSRPQPTRCRFSRFQRPFEFKYVAKFTPHSAEQPVSIVGQRTLVLEGIDLARNPITGYPNLDVKIIEVRDRLRQTPGILQQELLDALKLLAPVANYAGQVVQDNLYDSVMSEGEFQKRVRSFLRGHPMIGAGLEEHPRAAGGITDLSFKGIRLELKSESDKPLTLDGCKKFVGQAASLCGGERQADCVAVRSRLFEERTRSVPR